MSDQKEDKARKLLAERLARSIFNLGNEPKSECQRIEFKGGEWPDNEYSQGGLCFVALRDHIESYLRNYEP